ncbi:MAG: hypothetical protein RLZZ480_874 [Candidatus Parcubacteria bacterium]|jgi:endonuclease/exonuclease/phosphatase family metal-dependent hydrolase
MNNIKAIYWNVWGHRNAEEILAFLDQHRDAAVICLTEVTDMSSRELAKLDTVLHFGERADEAASHVNGYDQVRSHFRDTHDSVYHTASRGKWTCHRHGTVFRGVGFGSALLVRHDVTKVAEGCDNVTLGDDGAKSRVLQWVVIQNEEKRYLIAHLHGIWIQGNTKGDHELRTVQSHRVKSALMEIAETYCADDVIFGGDLNLDIDTSALRLLEGDGMLRNLIKEFGIVNTRTVAYRHFGLDGHSMYADYVLVSEGVDVSSLQVATHVSASDHAPLIVEFS